ncbi:MAG: hypothetical protein HRU41_03630 [Saprospiraceae bacterium]|nr:hypothetical protein [Saprospiraceae bacterium]
MRLAWGVSGLLCLLLSYYLFWPRSETAQGMPPRVMAVFPSADTLPANLLRMYIHFSKPMKTVGNLENIKLLDENHQEVMGAIFNNVHELWDHDQRQLTLILDPARVKTGLVAHQTMGRALQAGRYYTLSIEKLEDVDSKPLEETFTKTFWVEEEDIVAPNTENWKVHIPASNSKSPLVIQFPAMLDRLSLLQRVQLTDVNNQAIDGQVEIKGQETIWHFAPIRKWQAGGYNIYVHTRLEDPAGNNLNGLFDHEIGTLKRSQEDEIERIHFSVE